MEKIDAVMVTAILLASVGFLIALDWNAGAVMGGCPPVMANATDNDANGSPIVEHIPLAASAIEVLLLVALIQNDKRK